MNCLDCGVIIDTNHKRCFDCRREIKRAKNKADAKRAKQRRHNRGLVTKHMKGGKSPLVKAQCMRCKADIMAAENRRESTLCQPCRDNANTLKGKERWRRLNPIEVKMTGATCGICGSGFVNGFCECKE